MELDQGEIGVILGPSGSGKSTLHIIGGIESCDSSSVSVGNVDVTRLSDDRLTDFRRDQIGFVFQFYNLIPNRCREYRSGFKYWCNGLAQAIF